ncbi:hypothetical protein P4O66_011563 [Electrophorus voltai]|uniref:AMOP domain-containing protein n=1 Tax=Electrophorus voltai TaxID=2609070 RepID=A0AAD8Z632_9TELE|nr:hypothetical protein P4O66_011563 [Electrophorus voltai]
MRARGEVLRWAALLTLFLLSVQGFPTKKHRTSNPKTRSSASLAVRLHGTLATLNPFLLRRICVDFMRIISCQLLRLAAGGQAGSVDVGQMLEELQQENQLRSKSPPHQHKRRWSQLRSDRALSKPVPKEEEPFILDLKNFPDLANADLGSQNPNIQVTIEVVDDPQTEVEMDLAKEGRNDWPLSSEEWLGHKKLFWPLFWEYRDSSEESPDRASLEDNGEDLDYDGDDSLLSGVGLDWGNRRKGWDSVENYEYEEEEWSDWSPCSVTCGHGNQKRVRSCGYACTATESRTCELQHCPVLLLARANGVVVGQGEQPLRDLPVSPAGDVNAVTELAPHRTANGTDALDTGPYGSVLCCWVFVLGALTSPLAPADVDSCEKWLSCKNDFLQKYLHQVLTELPGCPCAYPSEVVYSAVNVFDERLQKSYRWRDASGPKERLDIYKPSARSCVRSMLSLDSTTLAAQHCCYDERMRLITRGKGAGAPNLISTEFSPELHYKVDVLPWILCKGDWSRFHQVRPPNNGLRCPENPREDVYINELEEAREY